MARTYRALLVPTAAIDAAGNAKPNAVFSVTPLAGGSPVAVYAAAQGGSALAADQIKTDALGNISGFYVDEPGPYVLAFTGGGTAVTTAIVDPRDTASPGDVATAVAGVVGGSTGAGGVSLNPDGSIQDSIQRLAAYDPGHGTSYPVFDDGAAVNPPAYPDAFTWDAQEQWFVVHQDGLYLVNGSATANNYSENAGEALIGWRADGGANPSYLGDAFATDDTTWLRRKGGSGFAKIIPMPAGSKVWLGITCLPGSNITLSNVALTITQLAIL